MVYKFLQVLFFSVLYLVSIQLWAQTTSDIRQVRWGFSPAQVKQAETLKPTSFRNEKLVYTRVPLASRTVGLEYTFNGDSLLSAAYYYYTTASVMEADVKAAWEELSGLLHEKYGPANPKKVGDSQTINWLTPRTQITLALGNVDRGWSLELIYLCRVCSGQPNAKVNTPWKARREIKDL